MRIITRYMIAHFLPVFALALTAFVGLYVIIDFFAKIDDILGSSTTWVNTLLYFLHRCPLIITQGVPMAVLLSALITLGVLKRNRELIAFKAAGVSPYAYAGPIMVMVCFIAVAEFWTEETIARSMDRTAQAIWDHKIRGHEVPVLWSQENVWYWGKNAIYHIRLYDQRRRVLENVSLFELDAEFNLRRRLDARQVQWVDRQWVAEQGVIIDLSGAETKQERFTRLVLELSETPDDFKGIESTPEDLGWIDLYQYARKIRQLGYSSTTYEVELQRRIAFPVTTVILALLGISIALRRGLHDGIASGALVALLIAFAYLTLSQMGCSLATAALVPPIIGVWSVNVIFAVLAWRLWVTSDQ